MRTLQRGNALISVMLAIFLMTLIAALGARKVRQEVTDSAAESTGKYLMTIRGAVLNALSQYHPTFTLINTSAAPAGTYPVSPAWMTFAGDTTTVSVKDLKDAGLVRNDFPDTPPLGRSAHIRFVRSGTCPGATCEVVAYIYTCWPISHGRAPGGVAITNCPSPPAGWRFDQDLVGKVMMATEGTAGNNAIDATRMHGTLFDIATADLGLSDGSPGHVAVLASLNDTLFNQFVRQGDERHIYLNDRLTVQGQIETKTGLLLDTDVIAGSACTTEGLYATTNRDSLAMCKGGRWFELTGFSILNSYSLANGQIVPTQTCPGAHLQPFYMASIQSHDSLMSGSNISVTGSFSGPASVNGRTDASGNVTGTGSVSGTFTSNSSSMIRVTQQVSIDSSNRVVMTNAQPSARALVIAGCRSI